MATLSSEAVTLIELARRLDPDGTAATVVELLNQTNEVLADMMWMEGNLPTGHRSTMRTGLPTATVRKLYGGVSPSRSRTRQVTDTCSMIEAYSEIDEVLANLNGGSAAWRMQEEGPFIESLNQKLVSLLFTGNEATTPEDFTGFSARYNDLSAENGENIIDAGGTGSDNASIWLVVWGANTCHGIVPKGSTAGISVRDKGLETITADDGGLMEAYRTHFRVFGGLTLRDWRYVVRIANIDKSDLTADASSGANLPELAFEAMNLIPNLAMGRPAFYMARDVRTKLHQQLSAGISNSTLTWENVGGHNTVPLHGIPTRRCDALAADEAQIT